MMEPTQEFIFDAAHRLEQGARENARVHGHSFYVEVTLRGEPDSRNGWVRDLGDITGALDPIRKSLDHRLLNEISDLGMPTLENIARYIFEQAKASLPEVVRVRVRRPSLGQSLTYEPAAKR